MIGILWQPRGRLADRQIGSAAALSTATARRQKLEQNTIFFPISETTDVETCVRNYQQVFLKID